jgi:Fe-S cluster biogenesis protein NfuA
VDDAGARDLVAGVERLLGEVEALGDPACRDTATALAAALLELHGEALARLADVVAAHDDGTIAAAAADDEVVSHVLLLHGLHPVPLAERVAGALDEVAPYLGAHGGGVELLDVTDGVVRLKLQGSCHGCPSSTATLKLAIEEAVHRAAPDVERIDAEGVAEPAPAALLQITPMGGADLTCPLPGMAAR